jgi:hypothetical protein
MAGMREAFRAQARVQFPACRQHPLCRAIAVDQRIESFLTDALALAGEDPDAIRKGVRVALADCEAIFRAQEVNTRMRDRAAHAGRVLCRARVVEELQASRRLV